MQILEEEVPRPTQYPWSEWADGKTRRAERGIDYVVSTVSFRAAARLAAKRMGMNLSTHIDGDSLVFRFTPRGEGGE